MTNEKRLEIGLFVMRLSIGIFFLALIIQKFLAYRPTIGDFTGFYSIETSILFYPILFTATALIIVFLSGLCKTFSYGLCLGIQLVFVGSMYNEILQPQQPDYVLFWASIPITGALIALFLLRDKDIFLSFSKTSNNDLNYQNFYWQH
ncbi:MAG: ATPase, partial [Cyanobacteria bacterium J06649_11]